MQLDLIYGWNSFARGIVEQLFEIFNAKIRDADVLDFAGCGELLHLLPV